MKTFQHDGKEYEIRLTETKNGWNGAVFYNGCRMSKITPIPRDTGAMNGSGMEAYLETIEKDFKNGND